MGERDLSERDASLLERATVEFQAPLNEEQLHKLFRDIANQQFARAINYSIDNNWAYDKVFGTLNDKPELRGIEVSGQIIPDIEYMKKGAVLLPFSGLREMGNEDYDSIDGIRFFVPPDYEVSDMHIGELEIMNFVREIAQKYPVKS